MSLCRKPYLCSSYHILKRDFYWKNQLSDADFEFPKYLRRVMQKDTSSLVELS
jgi:hypothetical protein